VTARPKPLHVEAVHFVRHHLGKGCFAPHTGCDWAAWRSFVYLVECYSFGGSQHAIAAMREVVRAAQPREDILITFVQAIPNVIDWGDVARLWPLVADGIVLRGDEHSRDPRQLTAIERIEAGRNGLGGKHVLHGWCPRKPSPEIRQ
jgi:hypothetical protein